MLILLVEDNQPLAELVIEYLEDAEFECDHTFNGKNAIELIQHNHYDLVILDINLPGCDGFQVCKTLRSNGLDIPCIMLTARDSLDDKLTGFDVGANDYLVKPFAMEELVARIKALTQRYKHLGSIQVGDLSLNVQEHIAQRGDRNIQLSPDEWRTLVYLARKSPNVVSRVELEDLLWPEGAPSSDALKMLTYRLRKNIDTPELPPLLHTIRGIGITLRKQE